MKKIILALFIATPLFAGSILQDKNGNFLQLKSSTLNMYSVDCDTTTATIIKAANTDRKGISIYNNGSYTVYIATYAATSNSALYPLKSGAEFNDEGIQCYTGVYYGLGTTASVNVRVMEKE